MDGWKVVMAEVHNSGLRYHKLEQQPEREWKRGGVATKIVSDFARVVALVVAMVIANAGKGLTG